MSLLSFLKQNDRMAYSNLKITAEALSVREQLMLDPAEPIGNINKFVSDIGHEYYELEFGDNFSAYCTHISDDRFAIVMNLKHNWNENFRRFTICHEIAHLTLIEHRAALCIGRLGKSTPEFQSFNELEREADYFAINLLVPRHGLDLFVSGKAFTFETLLEISVFFGVSILAAAFRFVELTDIPCSLISVDATTGFIKYEKRSRVFNELGKTEFLYGQRVSIKTNIHDVIQTSPNKFPYIQEVDLMDWYPEFKKRGKCIESINPLPYNKTYIVLLELIEDFEDG